MRFCSILALYIYSAIFAFSKIDFPAIQEIHLDNNAKGGYNYRVI